MWQLFGMEIARFSILVLAALSIFGLFWLYYDAWRDRKTPRDIPLLIGLVLLSVSFLSQGLSLETKVLQSAWTGEWLELARTGFLYVRAVAYGCIITGLLLTPIEDRPALNAVIGFGTASISLIFGMPLLAGTIALLYWRRASIGLEKHLDRVAEGFGFLALYELAGLALLFRTSSNPTLYRLVAPYGPLHLVQLVFLIVAMAVLARWTWYYLLKRLSTQLFILTLTGAVGLSLVVTGLFITLLLKNLEAESLQKLRGSARAVASLMEEKKARLISETRLLATDPRIAAAIADGKRKEIIPVIRAHMIQTGADRVVLVDTDAKIILRGENEEERGGSLSEDTAVQKALRGETVGSFAERSGILAPEVAVRAAIPVGNGALIAEQVFDTPYVDGLKRSTGLSVSLFGDKVLSATTEDVGDGKTRLIGLKETDPEIGNTVWEKGNVTAKSVRLGDREYLSGFVPLKDATNTTVGVLQVSEPQTIALQTAGRAVQQTFALVIFLIVILSVPIHIVCKRLVAEWT